MSMYQPIDPALYQRPDLRVALAAHQFGPVITAPAPTPLPSRLSWVHVDQVRDLTSRISLGDTHYADPDLAGTVAARASQLLDVPGNDPVKHALTVALAELRIEAGRAAGGAWLYRNALHHYTQALELAIKAGDAYCQAVALNLAGLASIEHGHPDHGLKLLQAMHVTAWKIPADEHRAVVVGPSGKVAIEATALVDSAAALVMLGDHDGATRALAKGRDLWTPTPADPFGDPDRTSARIELARKRLDVADAFAAASLRRWKSGRQISRTQTGIVQATIHVTVGETARTTTRQRRGHRGRQTGQRPCPRPTRTARGRAGHPARGRRPGARPDGAAGRQHASLRRSGRSPQVERIPERGSGGIAGPRSVHGHGGP
ncbi:MAG: hypothetical protein ACRDTE_11070 [Pseudonocardiaceae bacterium]